MVSHLSSIGVLLSLLSLTTADVTTTISTSSNWGTWEGWGVSLAWWAAKFGTNTNLADLFFTTNTVTFNSGSVPGLGLNMVRYNAGASSYNTYNGSTMVESSSIITSRLITGFWQDWASQAVTSSSWVWSADSNQRNMMALAKARGVDKFELFSNSPMWWMCTNHNPSGAASGSSDNLQSWNYDSHAIYLADIAAYAKANWGITFNSVEPFNEPISTWWSATGSQEGCHFATATQATVVMYLRAELNSRGLTSTLVSASDENTYDLAISTFNSFNSTVKGDIGRINVHGYQYGSGSRNGLYSLAKANGKALWNSEYGESDATGSQLASNLILDFRWLHPTAWTYWQAIDGSGWGLVNGDVQGGTIGAVSQKYFVLAQFTRHIREGMEILDGGSDYTVAAYSASQKKLVIVAVNWNASQYLNFDLTKFTTPGVNGALVARWSTQISSGDQYVSHSDTYLSSGKFWSLFAQNEVMTFEVSGVVM